MNLGVGCFSAFNLTTTLSFLYWLLYYIILTLAEYQPYVYSTLLFPLLLLKLLLKS
jgi:hypothetical protein